MSDRLPNQMPEGMSEYICQNIGDPQDYMVNTMGLKQRWRKPYWLSAWSSHICLQAGFDWSPEILEAGQDVWKVPLSRVSRTQGTGRSGENHLILRFLCLSLGIPATHNHGVFSHGLKDVSAALKPKPLVRTTHHSLRGILFVLPNGNQRSLAHMLRKFGCPAAPRRKPSASKVPGKQRFGESAFDRGVVKPTKLENL